jgi:sulfate adenylyltransferase
MGRQDYEQYRGHSAEARSPDSGLVVPHGGVLKDLIIDSDRARYLRKEAETLPFLVLNERQTADLELLLNGAFSPLEGFMVREDYESVCMEMRLVDGTLWPIPITLDVPDGFASSLVPEQRVTLRHPEGMMLAVMTVSDLWRPDLEREAECVYGTADTDHPGVFRLRQQTTPFYMGGKLEGLEYPPHHTFRHLRRTPDELRRFFTEQGWDQVIAFQTRNPMHRAHVALTKRAMSEIDAALLIQPVVGPTQPGDIDYFTRVQCYEAVLNHYPEDRVALNLLPLAMRMAGPREAVWHAIIRQNYGCSHFIIGRDHAGPKNNHTNGAIYEPYEAQELAQKYQSELGIRVVSYEEMVYVAEADIYLPRSEVPEAATTLSISGSELRRRLREGEEIPDWFSYPDVVETMERLYPPKSEQGFTVFFTGLSGSGKSTIANVLARKLEEMGARPVTLLDGDLVRQHLSAGLGFSRQDRDTNVRRVGWVAGQLTRNRGAVITSLIAPYRATRRQVREMVAQHGAFIQVYVNTPLEVCERRDRKGLYARARAGLIEDFTGIDDPYEVPADPEVTIDTAELTPEEAANQILAYLKDQGFISLPKASHSGPIRGTLSVKEEEAREEPPVVLTSSHLGE